MERLETGAKGESEILVVPLIVTLVVVLDESSDIIGDSIIMLEVLKDEEIVAPVLGLVEGDPVVLVLEVGLVK